MTMEKSNENLDFVHTQTLNECYFKNSTCESMESFEAARNCHMNTLSKFKL